MELVVSEDCQNHVLIQYQDIDEMQVRFGTSEITKVQRTYRDAQRIGSIESTWLVLLLSSSSVLPPEYSVIVCSLSNLRRLQ
jgi:hypothetical protein